MCIIKQKTKLTYLWVTYLRVHVSAVHVDLATAGVDELADVDDGLLEDAVRRGVGDHERGELVGVLGRLGREVGHVHVAWRRTGMM